MVIVADASPLICFAIIEKLDLLDRLFESLIVPEEVYKEVTFTKKPYSTELSNYLKDKKRKINNTLAVKMLSMEVDRGEAEAIVLALELGISQILIDDYKGRKVSQKQGLLTIGTIGALIESKKKNYITGVKPYMDLLIENDIRISKELYNKALELAGEI